MAHLIRLEALGLTAKVPSYVRYTDHGFVPNVQEFSDRIFAQFGAPAKIYPRPLGGVCISFVQAYQQDFSARSSGYDLSFSSLFTVKRFDAHIGYVQWGNFAANVLTRGHEEGHVADEFYRQLDQPFLLAALEKKLAFEQGVRLPLRQIREKEVLADLLGIYAMHRMGFQKHQLNFELRTPSFLEAAARYDCAKR